MMLGERSYGGVTVHAPPWPSAADDHAAAVNGNGSVDDYGLFFQTDSLKALQRYLPSNASDGVAEFPFADVDDAHTCDNFRMFEFKVRKCTRGRSHDWTECPFAHPGEKARRRDPRRHHYSGTACPDFRKGSCRRGDACEFAHGVFECWLHPARYRTQPCKDGVNCTRRVCFFAHSPEQLRVLSPRAAPDSPRNRVFAASPESMSPPATESPPVSPTVGEMVASLRQLQLSKVKSMPPPSWIGGGGGGGGCLSPRMMPPGYYSVPTTPTRAGPVVRPGLGYFDSLENEEEPPMERVESGRNLRAKMFEKLSKENPLGPDPDPELNPDPDVDWVADLIN